MGRALWRLCCSLKLAIVLASAATLLTVGGSLVMHFNPGIFGGMDRMLLVDWWRESGAGRTGLSWWLPATGLCVLLLAVNTACCFVDWARTWRRRWRKSGEYLLHLGFVLVVIAFFWGSVAGFRNEGNLVAVGGTLEVPHLPELTLRLDAFEPVLGIGGRPLDMKNSLALLRNGEVIRHQEVQINDPLLWKGLVVIPTSFGRSPSGFRFVWSGRGTVDLVPGTVLELPGGSRLLVRRFLPDAVRLPEGEVASRSSQLGNPAFDLELQRPLETSWRGWYFLRERLPFPLVAAGARLFPAEPVYDTVSVLTINRDPGAWLALAGGILMAIGVTLAMVSFYYKRARGDRPEVG